MGSRQNYPAPPNSALGFQGVSWGQVNKIPAEIPSLLPKFSLGSHLGGVHRVCPLPFFPQKPCPAPGAFPERGLCSQHLCGIFFLARKVPWDFCVSESHPADSVWEVFHLLPPVMQTGPSFLMNVSISERFHDARAGGPGTSSSCFLWSGIVMWGNTLRLDPTCYSLFEKDFWGVVAVLLSKGKKTRNLRGHCERPES